MEIKMKKSIYNNLVNNGLEYWRHKKFNSLEGNNENCFFCFKSPAIYRSFNEFIYNIGILITKTNEVDDDVELSIYPITFSYMMSKETLADICNEFVGKSLKYDYNHNFKSFIRKAVTGLYKYILAMFEIDVFDEYNADIFHEYDDQIKNRLDTGHYNPVKFIEKMERVRVVKSDSFVEQTNKYISERMDCLNKTDSTLEKLSKQKYTFDAMAASNYLYMKLFKSYSCGINLEMFLKIMRSRYEFDSQIEERIELSAMLLQLLDMEMFDNALYCMEEGIISCEFCPSKEFAGKFLFDIKYVYAGVLGFYERLIEESLDLEDKKLYPEFMLNEYKKRIHGVLNCITSYIHSHNIYENVISDKDINYSCEYFEHLGFDPRVIKNFIENLKPLYDNKNALLENIYNYTRTRDV